jgi:ketosteroid isomerase-like protein
MGARGPHDDFEAAKNVVRAGFAEFTVTQDAEEAIRKYASEDLEYVTRQGTFHGLEQWRSDGRGQLANFRLEIEVEEIIDAGDGALVVFNKARRLDKETGEVVWKAWPAVVVRVLDGKMVFFEGYVDRRKALADYGVERD